MFERVILRLVKKKIYNEVYEEVYPGKNVLFGNEIFTIKTYDSDLEYLLIQKIGYPEVYKYNGTIKLITENINSFCEWHNGPLDEVDDPTKRFYCPISSEGFCSKHKRSDRAIYSLCLSYRGEKALEACKTIDKKITKGEYIVYLIDYGGQLPKVGTTRKFRLLERIAEQPHIIATQLYLTDSLYKARLMEMNISKSGLANELWRHRWISTENLYNSIIKIKDMADKILKKFDIKEEIKLFRIRQPKINFIQGDLSNKELKLNGAWGGYLILSDMKYNYIYSESQLLHKDSILINNEIKL
ncbi:hypothetical protein Calag_0815 [Caldisphaera lagunensis DSM 15908]|uniref:DUF2797 domain-containing protein n=1 Tax=Caldisphaera lagunensis (strain DSM 15908 / JCM 11604 / ANMR 0165 / IC-154) TaxID=1056495 RepID=L0A9K9_CALLD|nr:DUF2797 domain-containing protein [Caldisphaera lagunensis]AFZ70556.1 hypothetical protein Calag_0815 [Caldisphaera lagunensis DSM 15908]